MPLQLISAGKWDPGGKLYRNKYQGCNQMIKKSTSQIILFGLVLFCLSACSPLKPVNLKITPTTEPLPQNATTIPTQITTRQPSITPLPTRVTPTVWPPYEPGVDWPEVEIEKLDISIRIPPGWQQISDGVFSGADGNLKISSRDVGFQGVEVFCTLESNQNSTIGEKPLLSLWNSSNGFQGCVFLPGMVELNSENGLIFAWYPDSAGKNSVLEIKVNSEFVWAIENGLKFTGSLPIDKPVLDLVPPECYLNQDPPTQTAINGLRIEEYRLTSADCYQQLNVEAFARLTPAKALETASNLRIQNEAYFEEISRQLAPFGYSIIDKKIYQGQTPITGVLEWIGNPVINQSETEFYLPVREWMTSKSLLISTRGSEEDKYSPFYSSLGYVPTRTFIGDDLYILSYNEENRTDMGYSLGIQVLKNEEIIYEMIVLPPNPASGPVRGLYEWDGHWILEASDLVIQDGVILNQKFGYTEMFAWKEMNGKPFYFFRQNGETIISFDGQPLPNPYQLVIHKPMCCSGGMVNMTLGNNGLAFYALRDGFWYYVILMPEI